jgi:TPR repeat protein
MHPSEGEMADSWEKGLSLLRSPRPSPIRSVADPSAINARRVATESTEDDLWLRANSRDGNAYAMERLALRLFRTDLSPRTRQEALLWLQRSADLGNPVAMAHLAESLLEATPTTHDLRESRRWFDRAVATGYTMAKVKLGCRLMSGSDMGDPSEGYLLLSDAAVSGYQVAHVRLAAWLLRNDIDRWTGHLWLARVGVTQAAEMSEVGANLYLTSLTTLFGQSDLLRKEAAALFCEAIDRGDMNAQVNLAYLLRRGEIAAADARPFKELLRVPLQARNSFAIMNQALYIVTESEYESDWVSAEKLIKSLSDPTPSLSWWLARRGEGDPEGYFVVDWLQHLGLVSPFEVAHRPERIALAKQAGWKVAYSRTLDAHNLADRKATSGVL